MKKIQKVK